MSDGAVSALVDLSRGELYIIERALEIACAKCNERQSREQFDGRPLHSFMYYVDYTQTKDVLDKIRRALNA